MERRLRSQEQRRAGFVSRRAARSHDQQCATFGSWLPARAYENHACVSQNNGVQLHLGGEDAFFAIEKRLKEARETIHLLFYSFELDATGTKIAELLVEKAKQGLTVRVLVDGFGSSNSIRRLKTLLTPHGAEVAVFLPSRISPLSAPRFNFINHRKIIVIDEELAFCGGMNIGQQYRYQWHDMMFEIRGSAVTGLSHVLLEDWYFSTQQSVEDPKRPLSTQGECEVAIISSGPDTEPWIHDAYFTAITQAQRQVYIATPYFIPTPSILTALRTARGRGVDVRLLLPSRSDVELVKWASRSFYPQLVGSGVRIFEYGPAMIHAKALLIDGKMVSVGTANVDNRSFRLNFEVTCFVNDPKLATKLSTWFGKHLGESIEVTRDSLRKKSVLVRLFESAAHLLSPLL